MESVPSGGIDGASEINGLGVRGNRFRGFSGAERRILKSYGREHPPGRRAMFVQT